jgi:predicted nuclease with TOPRIM domain
VTQAREESSVHRAESGRREDELRSCRERLNAALDSQQELLAKNTQKHELLLELQNQVSLLREDNAGKTSTVTILEDQVADLDAELRELRARTESGELRIESQLRAALGDLDVARSRITELSDENTL